MAELARHSTPGAGPSDRFSQRRSSLLPDLPYPGIRPFRKEEWPIFCGRQRIVDELLHALGVARFLPVLGTSGCGKSSLIKAGLISTLERESGMLGALWRTVEMHPANTPMWNLAEALWTATHPGPTDAKAPPDEVAKLRAVLGKGPGGIARVIESYEFPADHNLLLHVDQFEELFRFGRLGNESEVERFVDQLVDVFDGQPRGIYVVSTMRTDFLGDCAHFPRLADAFNQTGYLLRQMTEAELREAIERPARLYRGQVEPALVDRLIRDGGREPDLLPVTEHALMWMWIRTGKAMGATLTLEDYLSEDVGGIEGALSRHADKIYDGLKAVTFETGAGLGDLRPVAKHLFQALSETDHDGRVIRRPVPFDELCAVVNASQQDLGHVIDEFRKPSCSFLMPPHGKPLEEKTVIDVSHEALVRQWSKMKGMTGDTDWIDEEREDGETWKSLARAARKFKKNKSRLLPSDQSLEYRNWWRDRKPTSAWSRRYVLAGEDLFNDTLRLLKRSETLRKLKFAGTLVVVIGVILGAFYGVLFYVDQQNKEELLLASAAKTQAEEAQARANAAKLQAEMERVQSEIVRAMAVVSLLQKELELLTANSLKAANEWQTTDALVLAREALRQNSDVGAEAAAYAALARHRAIAIFPDVPAMDLSPDQTFVVLAAERSMRIVDLSTLTRDSDAAINGNDIDIAPGSDDYIENIAIGPQGRNLAVNYFNNAKNSYLVAIWDVKERKKLFEVATDGPAENLWFSPDGNWTAISDSVGVKVLELKTQRLVRTWHQENLTASSLVFSPDSRYLVAAAEGGEAILLDLLSTTTPERPIASERVAGFAAFQPHGHLLAVATDKPGVNEGTARSEIRLIDVEPNGKEELLEGPANLSSLAFSSDGRSLAEGSYDGTLEVLDINSRQIAIATKLSGAVISLAFSPDRTRLLAATENSWVHLIEIPSGDRVAMLPASEVISAYFADAGRKILTFGSSVRIWQVQPDIGRHLVDLTNADSRRKSPYTVSPKGCPDDETQSSVSSYSQYYSRKDDRQRDVSSDNTILAIDQEASGPLVLVNSKVMATLLHPEQQPEQIHLHKDIGTIAKELFVPLSGALDRNQQKVVVADARGRLLSVVAADVSRPDGHLLSTLADSSSNRTPTLIGIAADGSILAIRGSSWAVWDKRYTLILQDQLPNVDKDAGIDERHCNLAINANQGRVLRLVTVKSALASRAKLLLTALASGKGSLELPLLDTGDLPTRGAFSRDGRYVAAIHQSGTVGVWDTERQVLVARFGESYQGLLIPGFTQDGDKVVVAADDGSVYEWPVFQSRDTLLRRVEAALPENLSESDVRQILSAYQK